MGYARDPIDVCVSYIRGSNSLQRHMAAQIDDRIAGLNPASALAIFSVINHADVGPFTRNVNCWAAGIASKLTCMSPSNSERAEFMAGTAITKRHVLYCKHGGIGVGFPSNGVTLRFVAADNSIVLRTQSQNVQLARPDMCLGLLSADLPASIVPCPVASDDLLSYITYHPTPIPVMALDAEEKAIVKDIVRIQAGFVYTKTPTDAKRLEFHEPLVAGDSGDPVHVIINDELVLIGIVKDVDEHMSPCGFNADLNAAIVSVDALGGVSTGYTVTNPSLSSFGKGV